MLATTYIAAEAATYTELRVPPGSTALRRHNYDLSLFTLNENGMLEYNSETAATFTGIDVSAHQNTINWSAVASAGIEFTIIRAGYRGGTTGLIKQDQQFQNNITGALSNGIDVGVYFFSQAITPEEAHEEALAVLDWVAEYDITYPIVFDWEFQYGMEDCRTLDMDGETLTACAVEFCNTVYLAGYTPMVYFYLYLGSHYYDLSALTAYDFWVAEPNYRAPSFEYSFTILQYSHKASIAGITGDVDLNLCLTDYTRTGEAREV